MSSICMYMSNELANNIHTEIINKLLSTVSHIRKHAVITVFKIYMCLPELIPKTIHNIINMLEDKNPSVKQATLSVLLELVIKNPSNFIQLGPDLLKKLSNNSTLSFTWMTIKILQILYYLSLIDKNIKKRFIGILKNYIDNSNQIKSLIYVETIDILLELAMNDEKIVMLCFEKCQSFLTKNDYNLKYYALIFLNRIVKVNRNVVYQHSSELQLLLEINDFTIQIEIVKLLINLITKETFYKIINYLNGYIKKNYKETSKNQLIFVEYLICKCIEISSENNFEMINNLEWYVDFLFELCEIHLNNHLISTGELVSKQLFDLVIRVKALRPYIIPKMSNFISQLFQIFDQNPNSILKKNIESGSSSCTYIINVCIFCCGEYFENLENPILFIESISNKYCLDFCNLTQACFVQTLVKIMIKLLGKVFSTEMNVDQNVKDEVLLFCKNVFLDKLDVFCHSCDINVLDDAYCYSKMIKIALDNFENNNYFVEMSQYFSPELVSIGSDIQKKIPIPDGLDLDKWINSSLNPKLKPKKVRKKSTSTIKNVKKTSVKNIKSENVDLKPSLNTLFDTGK